MLKNISPVILASKSPRRQQLLQAMNIDFRVVLKEVDESYPENLSPPEIAVYISEKKAHAFDELIQDELVITADTIVSIDNYILGKPDDKQHAFEMLSLLSGRKHEVITGVSLLKSGELTSFFDTTEVHFRPLTADQINFYINEYRPFDKAGAYGIQDWIGAVAVERLVGSYTNVMGLPTHRLYQELVKMG